MKNLFHTNIWKLSGVVLLLVLFGASVYAQDRSNPTMIGHGTAVIPTDTEINSDAVTLYSQLDFVGVDGIASQNFEAVNDPFDCQGGDDFYVPAGQQWKITKVTTMGIYYNGVGPAVSVNVWIYSDAGGLPGAVVYTGLALVPTGLASGSFTTKLTSAPKLCTGHYWVSVQANMDFGAGGQWGWSTRTATSNNASAWQNPGGGFGTSCTSWGARVATCLVGTEPDFLFKLTGTILAACADPPFTVTSPNGGESWVIGSNHHITWTTTIADPDVKITLWNTGGLVQTIRSSTPNDGDYTWHTTGYSAGSDLKVKIQSTLTPSKNDKSDANFSLTVVDGATSQNYPNPFNPTTIISYTVPFAGNVHVVVYNTLGQVVSDLVNETQEAGTYESLFDASRLASGVYFYSIKAQSSDGSQSFNEFKKMMFLK